MYAIPAEMKHQMHLLPAVKEPNPNPKPESAVHRSRSVNTMKAQEAMNELEGIERQDVKINKYSRNDMKKRKLSNGRIVQVEELKESAAIRGLKKTLLEQSVVIKRLTENYGILEKQLLSQGDLMQYCKKIVDEEWETRKNVLLDQVIREYLPSIETLIQARVKDAVMQRKEAIDECILSFIKAKINDAD